MNQNKSQMIKLGALWKSRDGGEILSGTINSDTRIIVMPNKYKKEPKHPDYVVFLAVNERNQERKPVSSSAIDPDDIGF